jgi:hypothetical protein
MVLTRKSHEKGVYARKPYCRHIGLLMRNTQFGQAVEPAKSEESNVMKQGLLVFAVRVPSMFVKGTSSRFHRIAPVLGDTNHHPAKSRQKISSLPTLCASTGP